MFYIYRLRKRSGANVIVDSSTGSSCASISTPQQHASLPASQPQSTVLLSEVSCEEKLREEGQGISNQDNFDMQSCFDLQFLRISSEPNTKSNTIISGATSGTNQEFGDSDNPEEDDDAKQMDQSHDERIQEEGLDASIIPRAHTETKRYPDAPPTFGRRREIRKERIRKGIIIILLLILSVCF